MPLTLDDLDECCGDHERRRRYDLLVQKLIRYCNMRLDDHSRERAILGLMGEGDKPASWWVERLDWCRRREGWDDTRSYRPTWQRLNGASRVL